MSRDRRAIETLIMTYAECVDLGDFAGAAALFEHGTWQADVRGNIVHERGAAALQASFETITRRYPDGTPRTKHVTTNLIIDLDGHTATARCYYTVFQQTDTLALQPIAAGRYHDRFENVDGTWRFAERHTIPGLPGNLSQHLMLHVPGGEHNSR